MSGDGGAPLRRHRSDPRPSSRVRRLSRAALLLILAASALTDAGAATRPVFGPATRSIVVHGRARGLYPGATRRMRVVVRNPGPAPVRLVRITASVSNASTACRARNVAVRPFSGSIAVPGLGSARLFLRTRMRRAAPNTCQGVRFPVTLLATVTRA